MRFSLFTARVLGVAAAYLALTGCSGGGGLAGGGSSSGHGPDKEADAGDEESDTATQPQMVSGAFLTCGRASDGPQDATHDTVGCAAVDSQTQQKRDNVRNVRVTVATKSHATLKPPVTLADAGSPWNFHFQLDKAVTSDVDSVTAALDLDGKPVSMKTAHLDADPAAFNQTAPTPTNPAHTIFLSSRTFAVGGSDADTFDSAQAADQFCDGLAKTANLAGNWHALLSDKTASVKTRVQISGAVVDTKGTTIAAGASDFWGVHQNLIKVEETGKPVTNNFEVWTGSSKTGDAGDTCESWSEGSFIHSLTSVAFGSIGNANDAGGWLNADKVPCGFQTIGVATKNRLYCISTP